MSILGTRIGRFRVGPLLGRGGMGEVYVGLDETLQRKVALKSISARKRLDEEAKARFLREAQVLSRLDHPNICKIFDLIEDADRDFLVLELVQGRDLHSAIQQGLPTAQHLPIACQITSALAAAHAEGVIHRDLKPENVMLTPSGEVKVLDFGLARTNTAPPSATSDVTPRGDSTHDAPHTDASNEGEPPPSHAEAADRTTAGATSSDPDEDVTLVAARSDLDPTLAASLAATPAPSDPRTVAGTVMGTITYMSPEQARGEPLTTASDLYSLGLVLQTLFTGRSPYPPGASRTEILRRAREAQPLAPAGLDADLTRLLEDLRAPAPAARPTAVETAARLRWIAERPKRWARRFAIAAVLTVLAFGALKYTLDLRRERSAAIAAREEAELRRTQAEDLIGFMIGDLREKLAPVGRLAILDEVGDKALEYFASLPQEALSDDELARRSKALYQVGEVRLARGTLEAAKAPLSESLALAQSLAEREPSNVQRLFGLGQSHFWIGYVHLQLGELDDASRHFQAYFDASQRLNQLEPDNPEWRLELAYGHNNLGEVLRRQGEIEDSLVHYRASADLRRQLMQADPDDPKLARDFAHARSLLGQMLVESGELEAARGEHQAALAMRRELLAADPEHTDWQWNVSISLQHLGRLELWQGDAESALAHFQEAESIGRQLVARDADNARWQDDLANTQSWIGAARIARGEPRLALASLQQSTERLEALSRKEPGEALWQRDLATARLRSAEAQLRLGNAAAALAIAQRVQADLAPARNELAESTGSPEAAASPPPAPPELQARALLIAGRALADLGNAGNADDAFARARDLLQPLAADTSDPALLALWEQALRLTQQTEAADAVRTALRDRGYGAQTL